MGHQKVPQRRNALFTILDTITLIGDGNVVKWEILNYDRGNKVWGKEQQHATDRRQLILTCRSHEFEILRTSGFYVMSWVFCCFFSVRLCRFWVVIRFHPHHNGQWPPTSKDFYTRSYPLHYFLILILEKEPVFLFSMLSAKQGNYCCHFYNVFGMTRSLTGDWTQDLLHSMPALYH